MKTCLYCGEEIKVKASFITHTEPDPVGEALGTRMIRFESKFGLDGLLRENGDMLEVLAVAARIEGQGAFRNFIAACQREYKTVIVWFCDNKIVADALVRYGFTPETAIDGVGEVLDGFRWDMPDAERLRRCASEPTPPADPSGASHRPGPAAAADGLSD